MKRALQIIGWTLLGVVLTVVIAVTIVCYVVFTPERLTPIARDVADRFITAEHEIGSVDLTFFSTFPRFGLRADGLLIVNPKAGAQNDTVVAAPTLVATVDVMEFLNHRNLHVHEAILDDAFVNFYIAPDGTTNLTDVFVTSPDTTEEDTTAFSLPFDELKVDGLRIKAHYITFLDDKDTISASLGETDLAVQANSWEDMFLSLDAQNVCASLKGETYADSLRVKIDAPMAMNLDSMHFAFRRAELAVNEFALVLSGSADIQDSIGVDMGISTKGKWQIKPLMALIPEKFAQSLSDWANLAGMSAMSGLICHLPLVARPRSRAIESRISAEPLSTSANSLTASSALRKAKCMESRFIAMGASSLTLMESAYRSPLSDAHTSFASRDTNISLHFAADAASPVSPKAAEMVSLASSKVIYLALTRSPSTRSSLKGREKAAVSSSVVSGEVTKTSVRLVVPSGAI